MRAERIDGCFVVKNDVEKVFINTFLTHPSVQTIKESSGATSANTVQHGVLNRSSSNLISSDAPLERR
jgi:hypothetical protein